MCSFAASLGLEINQVIPETSIEKFTYMIIIMLKHRKLISVQKDKLCLKHADNRHSCLFNGSAFTYFAGDLTLQYLNFLSRYEGSLITLAVDHVDHAMRLQEISAKLFPGFVEICLLGKISLEDKVVLSKRKGVNIPDKQEKMLSEIWPWYIFAAPRQKSRILSDVIIDNIRRSS
jgi:hypothetical protein